MKNWLFFLLLGLLPSQGFAGASATLLEQGYLSSVRTKFDLTHAYLNPALLGDLQGARLDAATTYLFDSNPRYIGPSGQKADLFDAIILPSAHLGGQVTDDCGVAGNLLSPFGVGLEHYQREAILKSLEISANAGCRVNEHVSVGAGLSGLETDAYMKDVVPLPAPLSNGRIKLDAGKSWDIGWNVGALFKWEPVRLGISYRAPYHIHSDVRAHWWVPGIVKPLFPNSHGVVDTNLPGNLSIGASWTITDNWELWLNWRRDFWSQSQHLKVDFRSSVPLSITNFNWRDSESYAMGLAGDWHTYSTELSVFYDQTPIPNAASRQWIIPDSNRVGFRVSGGYRITPSVKLTANYEHVGFQDTHANIVPGKYRGVEYHLLSAKIGWEF